MSRASVVVGPLRAGAVREGIVGNTVSDFSELFIPIIDNQFQPSDYWAGDASGLDGASGAGSWPVSEHPLSNVSRESFKTFLIFIFISQLMC